MRTTHALVALHTLRTAADINTEQCIKSGHYGCHSRVLLVLHAHGAQLQQLWWCVLQDAGISQLLHLQPCEGSELGQGLLQEVVQAAV